MIKEDENFRLNQRIRMTQAAIEELGEGNCKGVFVGYSRHGQLRVIKDGHSSIDIYDISLWEPDDTIQSEQSIRVGDIVTIHKEQWTFRGDLFVVTAELTPGWFELEFLFGENQGDKIRSYETSDLLKLPSLGK